MIDPQAKPKSYLRLMVLVIILGIASALVTFAFVALVHQGTNLIWEQTTEALVVDPRLFTILVCTIGGLVIGLLVKLFGDHNAIFAELMQEFGKTGRFDYRHAPGIVITAFVSLINGDRARCAHGGRFAGHSGSSGAVISQYHLSHLAAA